MSDEPCKDAEKNTLLPVASACSEVPYNRAARENMESKTDVDAAPVDAVVQLRWSEMIFHMTGSGDHVKNSAHGYRNHYCATVESQQYSDLMTMEEHGLVVGGVFLNQRKSRYFHATEKGCAFAGMSKAATKRATSS